jgi:hypothetical protein
LDERVSDISDRVNYRGSLCRSDGPKVVRERKDRPPITDCAELWVHCVIQNTVRREGVPDGKKTARLVRKSVDLKWADKYPENF